MICAPCKDMRHDECPGLTSCDCQHRFRRLATLAVKPVRMKGEDVEAAYARGYQDALNRVFALLTAEHQQLWFEKCAARNVVAIGLPAHYFTRIRTYLREVLDEAVSDL